MPISVEIDPQAVRPVGEEAVSVAIDTPHVMLLARDEHDTFDIAQGGQANGLPSRTEPPLHQASFMNDLHATSNFHIQRGRPLLAGAGDLVFRFDDAIAVGIHIEIEVVTAHFIDDDDNPA